MTFFPITASNISCKKNKFWETVAVRGFVGWGNIRQFVFPSSVPRITIILSPLLKRASPSAPPPPLPKGEALAAQASLGEDINPFAQPIKTNCSFLGVQRGKGVAAFSSLREKPYLPATPCGFPTAFGGKSRERKRCLFSRI